MIKDVIIDMENYMIWSPAGCGEDTPDEMVALIKRYDRVANEFFELNSIFEQLWRHQNNRPLWATPDVSKYIKE